MSAPDDPRDLLGEPLWDALGTAAEPQPSPAFDARFRARLDQERRPRWHWGAASGLAVAALAAGLVIGLRPPPVTPDPDPVQPPTDLALVAELELVENLPLLADLDVLMAWDGTAP